MLLKEISLGLVLLFGGDSDAARRAGDALLADRIGEAVTEGGFAHIDYASWRKEDGSASTLRFTDVVIARDAANVEISDATIAPFSNALRFDDGEFRAEGDDRTWRFAGVQLRKAGFFSHRVRLTAQALRVRGGGSGRDCDAADLNCALDAASAPIDEFVMNFNPRGEAGAAQIAWRRGEICHALWSDAEGGGAEFVEFGRALLDDAVQAGWRGARIACDETLFDTAEPRIDALEFDVRGEVAALPWSEVYRGNEVLLDTLFSLVPESYAYLLE